MYSAVYIRSVLLVLSKLLSKLGKLLCSRQLKAMMYLDAVQGHNIKVGAMKGLDLWQICISERDQLEKVPFSSRVSLCRWVS